MQLFQVTLLTRKFLCKAVVMAESDRSAKEKIEAALVHHTHAFLRQRDSDANIPSQSYEVVDATMTPLTTDVVKFEWDLRATPSPTNEGNCEA